MKLLLCTIFAATVCCVNAGKKQRMMAAMNAMNGGMMGGMNGGGMMGGMNGGGMMGGMNGGMMGGMNGGGMMGGMNGGGMMGGMNGGGMMGGMNRGMMAGGLNPPMVAGGGAGFIGQPQFAQFVPGVPAFAAPAPLPNVYAVPAVNGFPFMGAPPMAQINPPQQPLMQQQQLPLQPDPFRRFKRQLMKQNILKTTVDTQDIMKLQTALLLVCLFRTSFALPLQIGIIASNSNEILRLNGLTLATLGQTQASSILPQYVLQQQQPEVLLTPQVVNLNPQMTNPFGPQGPQFFFPNQGNQLTPMIIPNGQQEQLGPSQDANNPNVPQQAQNPFQMFPQFQFPSYGFPQFPRQQGFPYFMPPYGYPQQRNNVLLQPNNGQPKLERTTQRPQLPLQQASQPKVQTDRTWPLGTQKESTTIPPDPRGDASGPGVDEGHNFPFLFEP